MSSVGVLDIQGSVEEHLYMLRKAGLQPIAVKTKKDLRKVSGLIIPGGESTIIGKMLKQYGLDKDIKKRTNIGKPRPLSIWGTCAGAILLAKKVVGKKPDILNLVDIEIARNAYGRQLDSFETEISIPTLGGEKFRAVFIRAPIIKKTSATLKILAQYNGQPVMLRQKNLLITTFHPELTEDLRVHRYFISMVQQYAKI